MGVFNIRSASRTAAGVVAMLASAPAWAEISEPSKDLLSMSLSELSDVEVTSVSKKSEKEFEAPAAVYVITQEDIQRSGATSIPEALRMVPGLDVARSGAHGWAVASRGFNDQFSNKLLVLIDGRTVYTPLFSGTFWDQQDTFLADIDRIEVVRGPGGTLWGANAVNGVINIITKKASDTQGGYVNATVGTQNIDNGVRYGGKVADTAYRLYGKENFTNEFQTSTSTGADDFFRKQQGGFRSDTQINSRDSLTVQGDAFTAHEASPITLPHTPAPYTNLNDQYGFIGGNVLTRWRRALEGGNEMLVQAYVDYNKADTYYYGDKQATFDLDFQHSFDWGSRQNVVWGAGYRLVSDNFRGTFWDSVTPAHKQFSLYSTFVQDKINISDNRLFLTLGTKIEHNDFSGLEFQPSARVTYLIDKSQTFWTSVSRAVRTPSRSVDGLNLIATTAGSNYVEFGHNRSAEAETLVAYEAGYRIKPTLSTSLDFSLFHNRYDRLINLSTTSIGGGYIIQTPYNSGKGDTDGGELAANWQVNRNLKLTGGYSLLEMFLKGSSLVTSNTKSPQQQFSLRAYSQLSDTVQWDNMLYWVDTIKPISGLTIGSYARYDTRLGWKCLDNVELSLVGQNLFNNEHKEFSPFLYNYQTEVPRSVYANVRWKF